MSDGKVARAFQTRYSYYRFQTDLAEPSARTATEPLLTTKPHFGLTHLSMNSSLPLGKTLPLQQLLPGDETLRPQRLATLLQNTLGLLRYEVGAPRPLHRGAPSPRCLYSSELYVCLLEDGWGAGRGIYRYNPIQHALEKRAGGDGGRRSLQRATGRDPQEFANVRLAVVLNADFWRIARLYSDFAFHLASLEGGQVLGQLELLAGRLGWTAEVVECFEDDLILEALGLDRTAESALAVLLLREGEVAPSEEPSAAGAGAEEPAPPVAVSRFREEIQSCRELQAMLEASRCHSGPRTRPSLPVSVPNLLDQTDLEEAILHRSSANDVLGFSHRAVALDGAKAQVFWDVLTGEITTQARALGIDIYTAVNAVEGVESGFYRGGRRMDDSSSVSEFLAAISSYSEVQANLRHVPLMVFPAADFHQMITEFGDRGYQIAVLRAGQVTQWISLLASSQGWWARTMKSYYDSVVETKWGLADSNFQAVCKIAIGEHSIPSLSFEMRL